MNAVLKSPFDALIASIEKDPHFLSPANIVALRKILPPEQKSDDFEMTSLKRVLEKQMALLERLQSKAMSSEADNDITEISKIMNAGRQMMDTMIKYGEKIDAQNRQIQVENAVVETFKEMENPELLTLFMQKLKKNLAKKGSK